jgi:3-deoxy-D-manno-octulosonic-acid transferase
MSFASKLKMCGRQLLERPLYGFGIRAYATGVRIAALRNPKAKLLIAGHKRIWSDLKSKIEPDSRYIWIHTSSLGEFEQGRPLIEKIKREHPEYKILLTFFSPSGYEVRKNYTGADVVVYLPFDTRRNIKRFLNKVNPVTAIFVKYEFWLNCLKELSRREIPTYLISAPFRRSQLFFKRTGAWYRSWLKYFTHLYVQDDNSRSLLAEIGVDNVTVAGDTRFDRVVDIMSNGRKLPVLDNFRSDGKFVLMAGSSWQEDEAVYFPWLHKNRDVKAVIAPHEFDAGRIAKLKEAFPGEVACWSEIKDSRVPSDCRILLMDCFGLLSSAYRYADMVYVGGGFGAGLHNINEAAVYGVPVIFGPNNRKFIEAQEIQRADGGFEVKDATSFAKIADSLVADYDRRKRAGQNAGDYIRSKLGATDIIFKDLFPLPNSQR